MFMGTGPTRIDQLSSAEKLVVWSMRIWVANYSKGAAARDILTGAFSDFGVEEASCDLDRFMMTLAHSDKAEIAIQPPYCPKLSGDERRLLSVFSLLQRGDVLLAMDMMAIWMNPKLTRLAVTPAFAAAELFAQNGLNLRMGQGGHMVAAADAEAPALLH